MESKVEKAVKYFKNGCNCAQAVLLPFADFYNLDESTALKISASFGGGMGGMREVCGSVSAMAIVAGLATGSTDVKDKEAKQKNYDAVQFLFNKFKTENGSIYCKQLRGLEESSTPVKKLPCVEYVKQCTQFVADYLEENNL